MSYCPSIECLAYGLLHFLDPFTGTVAMFLLLGLEKILLLLASHCKFVAVQLNGCVDVQLYFSLS